MRPASIVSFLEKTTGTAAPTCDVDGVTCESCTVVMQGRHLADIELVITGPLARLPLRTVPSATDRTWVA